MNLFTGFETSPFLSKDRFSNINFGYGQNINLNVHISLPEGYTIDALPKAITLINEDKTVSFTRQLFTEGNKTILARIRIELNKTEYNMDEYSGIKEFYKKMIDLLNEQIVLKKK
jgi:hypothetical protein